MQASSVPRRWEVRRSVVTRREAVMVSNAINTTLLTTRCAPRSFNLQTTLMAYLEPGLRNVRKCVVDVVSMLVSV